MSYKATVEIDGPERVVEKMIHELRKECDNANRYGKDVSVRRVEEQSEHTEGFDDTG